MSSKSIIQNSPFGNIFTKSGKGKKNFGGKNVTQFLKKILGNRVFDLYLKYLGIASLTTSTLVPFGLVLSAEYADKIIKKKSLGKFDKSRIPILDNSMIGNYLKIAGLSLLELPPATLLPLGVIMIIYELGIKNLLKQTGGRLSIGSTIPANFVQKIDAIVSGQSGAGLFEAYDLLNPKIQQECGGGACGPNNITKPYDFRVKGGTVKGFKNNKTPQADSVHEIKFVKNSAGNIDAAYKGNDKVLHLMAGGSASGKKQTGGKNVYTKIVNPKTGRKVNINGALGKSIVKNYLSFLNGGSVIQDATFSLSHQEATHALELCDRKLSQFYKKQFGGAAAADDGIVPEVLEMRPEASLVGICGDSDGFQEMIDSGGGEVVRLLHTDATDDLGAPIMTAAARVDFTTQNLFVACVNPLYREQGEGEKLVKLIHLQMGLKNCRALKFTATTKSKPFWDKMAERHAFLTMEADGVYKFTNTSVPEDDGW